MTNRHTDAWLRFYVSGENAGGVDTRTLSSLLNDFSDATLAAARLRLGLPVRRPGRISSMEARLAAIRVESVLPGSLELAFKEPPPVSEYQSTLAPPLGANVTADDVAKDLIRSVERAKAGEPPSPGQEQTRLIVDRLLRRASTIGDSAELSHRSITGERTTVTIDLRLRSVQVRAEETTRTVTMYGHAYMADVAKIIVSEFESNKILKASNHVKKRLNYDKVFESQILPLLHDYEGNKI